MPKNEDFAVIDRALAGEQSAFEELFNKYQARIRALLMRLTHGNIANSEDLMQESFRKAFSKLRTFKKEACFYTWLYKIATNEFLMFYRIKHPFLISIDALRHTNVPTGGSIIIENLPEERGPFNGEKNSQLGKSDQALENIPNRIMVEKLLESLPHGYRRIIILHDLLGFEYKDAAIILRCSTGNAKSQRHKAIQKMRQALHIQNA